MQCALAGFKVLAINNEDTVKHVQHLTVITQLVFDLAVRITCPVNAFVMFKNSQNTIFVDAVLRFK